MHVLTKQERQNFEGGVWQSFPNKDAKHSIGSEVILSNKSFKVGFNPLLRQLGSVQYNFSDNLKLEHSIWCGQKNFPSPWKDDRKEKINTIESRQHMSEGY